jgi:hypothetical protein
MNFYQSTWHLIPENSIVIVTAVITSDLTI